MKEWRMFSRVTRNRGLLEKFARIAETAYAVGKGVQQDALEAQVEISKLTEQLTLLDQRRQLAEARMNSLLFREPETPLGVPRELKPRTCSSTKCRQALLTRGATKQPDLN